MNDEPKAHQVSPRAREAAEKEIQQWLCVRPGVITGEFVQCAIDDAVAEASEKVSEGDAAMWMKLNREVARLTKELAEVESKVSEGDAEMFMRLNREIGHLGGKCDRLQHELSTERVAREKLEAAYRGAVAYGKLAEVQFHDSTAGPTTVHVETLKAKVAELERLVPASLPDIVASRNFLKARCEKLEKALDYSCSRLRWIIQYISEEPFKPWANTDEWVPTAKQSVIESEEALNQSPE